MTKGALAEVRHLLVAQCARSGIELDIRFKKEFEDIFPGGPKRVKDSVLFIYRIGAYERIDELDAQWLGTLTNPKKTISEYVNDRIKGITDELKGE